MFLTEKMLIKHKACPEGIEWFRNKYPNGLELTDEIIVDDEDEQDYALWFATEFKHNCTISVTERLFEMLEQEPSKIFYKTEFYFDKKNNYYKQTYYYKDNEIETIIDWKCKNKKETGYRLENRNNYWLIQKFYKNDCVYHLDSYGNWLKAKHHENGKVCFLRDNTKIVFKKNCKTRNKK